MSGFIVQEPKSDDHDISGLKNGLYPTGDSNRAWGFGLCTIPGSRGKRTPPNIQEGKNRGVRWLAAAELARRGSTGPGAGPARARPVLASPSQPYINRPNPVPVPSRGPSLSPLPGACACRGHGTPGARAPAHGSDMDKSAAAADDVERGDYEQEHERTGARAPSPFFPSPCFGRFLVCFGLPGIGQDFGDSFGLLSSFGVFFFPSRVGCRDGMDGDGAHCDGGDRLRRAGAGVERGAAGLGRGAPRARRLRVRHLLHLHAARQRLPRAAPRHRRQEPHLHGRRQIIPQYARRLSAPARTVASPPSVPRAGFTDERRNAWKSQVPERCSCAASPSTSTCGAPWSATPSPRP